MGSASDWEIMREAAKQLTDFAVPFETKVLSAHRTPDALEAWVKRLSAAGARCFIAGAGRRCSPGGSRRGEDDRARARVPIALEVSPRARFPVVHRARCRRAFPLRPLRSGRPRRNAGLFAVAMLAQSDAKLAKRLVQFRAARLRR